jgi:biopolymer transport protein ExbD
MQSGGADDDLVQGINVTPLVDITLVLLIIFMVTATFVTEQGLKVDLPKAATVEASPTPALTITLGADGRMRLMKLDVDMNGLRANLTHEVSLNPAVKVLLKAHKSLTYEQVAAVLDCIKSSGIKRVALAMDRR